MAKMRITKNITEYNDVYNSFKTNPEIHFDHQALAAGYLSRNDAYIETYDGHHGHGFLVHIPTANSNLTGSKTMHIIEYWLTEGRYDL